jgi:hypothetical protein
MAFVVGWTGRSSELGGVGDWPSGTLFEAHTAPSWGGVKPGFEAGSFEAVQEANHEPEVHTADEIGVLLGEGVEGAVGQSQSRGIGAWLIAILAKHVSGGRQ